MKRAGDTDVIGSASEAVSQVAAQAGAELEEPRDVQNRLPRLTQASEDERPFDRTD
jgi:hypothetical protein